MSHINDQNILLKAQLSAAGASQATVNYVEAPEDRFKFDQLQNQVQAFANENSHQKTKITFYECENARLLNEIEQLKISANDSSQLKLENAELASKIESMTKDQEDLLELLADQDLQLKSFRGKMRELGQQVEPSDDEN